MNVFILTDEVPDFVWILELDMMANCNSNKPISESEYTKEGLALWLNNMPERSELHFKENLERTPIFAGYVFVLSMVSTYSKPT